MKFYFLTLFPEIIKSYFSESILNRGIENQLFDIEIINIRDFSKDKHKRTDDYPYGGGAGMLMTPQPIADAIKSIPNYENCQVIYPSPSGKEYKQSEAKSLHDLNKDIIFICGHYEGIDQRIIDLYVDNEYSVGDYVLTGGELPALAIADSVVRNIPGVLGNNSSLNEESFTNDLLEYPQYTRPSDFEGLSVPDILLSGHHKKIEDWRKDQSIKKTEQNRPDMYSNYLKKLGDRDERKD